MTTLKRKIKKMRRQGIDWRKYLQKKYLIKDRYTKDTKTGKTQQEKKI